MHPIIETTHSIRNSFKHYLSSMSLDALNKIPEGFNNNIFWNIGHIISVQQMIVVGLANERWTVDKRIVKEFMKGSKPERAYTEEDRMELLQILETSLQETQALFDADKLNTYQSFKTLTGYEITDFTSACAFNLFHEGMHLGTLLSIKKFVK